MYFKTIFYLKFIEFAHGNRMAANKQFSDTRLRPNWWSRIKFGGPKLAQLYNRLPSFYLQQMKQIKENSRAPCTLQGITTASFCHMDRPKSCTKQNCVKTIKPFGEYLKSLFQLIWSGMEYILNILFLFYLTIKYMPSQHISLKGRTEKWAST